MSSRSIAADENGDIYLPDGANVALVTGQDAVIQNVSMATKKILGENPFNSTEGIDYFGTVFNPQPDYDQFRFQLTQAALSVPDVVEVVSVSMSRNESSVEYVMQINSIYGPATVTELITK